MIRKGDRVRHIEESLYEKYGVLEVWEIKNGYAVCRFGDFSNFGIVDVEITSLKRI